MLPFGFGQGSRGDCSQEPNDSACVHRLGCQSRPLVDVAGSCSARSTAGNCRPFRLQVGGYPVGCRRARFHDNAFRHSSRCPCRLFRFRRSAHCSDCFFGDRWHQGVDRSFIRTSQRSTRLPTGDRRTGARVLPAIQRRFGSRVLGSRPRRNWRRARGDYNSLRRVDSTGDSRSPFAVSKRRPAHQGL